MKEMKNDMELTFDAISSNEGLARVAVAAFVSRLNPTIEELADIKTAVSEAVTNAIIHGYGNIQGYCKHGEALETIDKEYPGKVRMKCQLEHGVLKVMVEDQGRGIENVEKAIIYRNWNFVIIDYKKNIFEKNYKIKKKKEILNIFLLFSILFHILN